MFSSQVVNTEIIGTRSGSKNPLQVEEGGGGEVEILIQNTQIYFKFKFFTLSSNIGSCNCENFGIRQEENKSTDLLGKGIWIPRPSPQTVTVNIPFQDFSHWATMIHKTNCSQTQDLHYNTVAVVIHFQLGA